MDDEVGQLDCHARDASKYVPATQIDAFMGQESFRRSDLLALDKDMLLFFVVQLL